MIRRSEQREKQSFSMILKYYFWIILIMNVSMCIHTTTVLIIWRDDLKFPFTPLFVSGSFDASFMPVVPFTSFILTVEKCLIFLLDVKYNRSWMLFLLYLGVLISILAGGANFVMNILFHNSELPDGCIAYGCTLYTNAQLVYTYTRTTGMIVNTVAGFLFLIIISWLKKKQPQVEGKMKTIAEAIVMRVVIFGLLCDFAPHITDALFISITGDSPFNYIGPYSRFIMAIDLLLSSMLNWLVFLRAKKTNTLQITITS